MFKTVGVAAEAITANKIVRFVSGENTVELADDATLPYLGVSRYDVAAGDNVEVWGDFESGVPITANASIKNGVPLMATTGGVAAAATALTGAATRYLIGVSTGAISSTQVSASIQRGVSFVNS